ncbi:MAG: hypothetical protein DWQ08_00895 [Proteobacteria bacterium]|nr:MAG: hypothetical protein DWQ08_00895 [Pseudomonadota bacterium]
MFVVELELWRKHDIGHKATVFVRKNHERCDQDARDHVLGDAGKELDPHWNLWPSAIFPVSWKTDVSKTPGYRETVESPTIVHVAKHYCKPWIYPRNGRPFADRFFAYHAGTCWTALSRE